jgi:hypothetical protein
VIGLITGCLVDVVAVMGDVFDLVYNFHVPLAFECRLSGRTTETCSSISNIK